MSERANNFDLKLLTSSKEVGLRRLRSYAATLGGGAQIFNTHDDLRRNLESNFQGRRINIVLHDDTVLMTAQQLLDLQKYCRVFVLQRPDHRNLISIPQPAAPCWNVESYLQCSLATFLDSPVVRMSMAQMCKSSQSFHLEHLLRWGHATSTYKQTSSNEDGVADASLAFVRNLSLVGEGRRLTEMFSHFIQVRLKAIKLDLDTVTFGSDGLLITVIARCRPAQGMLLRDVVEELRIHDFPISVVNRLNDGSFEIAALHYPFQLAGLASERILMVFNKSREIVEQGTAPLLLDPVDKAG